MRLNFLKLLITSQLIKKFRKCPVQGKRTNITRSLFSASYIKCKCSNPMFLTYFLIIYTSLAQSYCILLTRWANNFLFYPSTRGFYSFYRTNFLFRAQQISYSVGKIVFFPRDAAKNSSPSCSKSTHLFIY